MNLNKQTGVSLLSGLAIALAALSFNTTARANVYATNIKLNGSLTTASGASGSPVSISYILNEPATAGVTVKVLQGNTVVATIVGGTAKGLNTVSWTPSSAGTYSVSITAAATGFSTWTQTSVDTDPGRPANYPIGIAVDNNTNSPYYGRVVVGNALVGTNPNIAAAAKKVGFYKNNADGSQADEGWYGNANYLADDGGDAAAAGQMPNSGGFDPMKIRIGEDDRIYWVDNSDYGAILSTDILATTNKVVICEGGPGFPGGGADVGPSYSQNPNVGDVIGPGHPGFQVFDILNTTTTNAAVWLGDNDFASWGVQIYHMTNGIVDTNDTLGTQAVYAGTGSTIDLLPSGGLMVDYNLDIYVSQSRFNNNPNIRSTVYTNFNGGVIPPENQSSGLADTTQTPWAIGLSDPTLCSIQDTVINSRTAPTMVALPMSTGVAGTFSGGISVRNTSDGSPVVVTNGLGTVIQSLTNLDYPQIYRCAAWDNVGNLYGGSTTLNVWRVFSPPGANTNTTVAVATVAVTTPLAITSIVVNGTSVTVNFTGSASDPASAFTLMSSALVIPASGYTPDAGAVITQVSPGVFKAVTTTSGSARFYRIKR